MPRAAGWRSRRHWRSADTRGGPVQIGRRSVSGRAAADDLDAAMRCIRLLAYAILDGTLIPIDRVADQKPTTPANTSVTERTCRSSPTRLASRRGISRAARRRS